MSSGITKIIREKLKEIERAENVRILLAIESGSRAWGFASPDSDYDVRFIYVRNRDSYLRLDSMRDVIEWQLDDTLDINGWDIRKALQLLFKSNPTIFEWCTSPIIYHRDPLFDSFQTLLDNFFSPKKSLYHYWHMASTNYREYLKTDEVRIKKYFYVLRPLLAAQWVLRTKTPPPMLFDELVKTELEPAMKPIVNRLVEQKMATPEMGKGKRIDEINDYVEHHLVSIKESADSMAENRVKWDELNTYFLSLLDNKVQ
ncbi:putative nucleotidyltransferase [Lachnospiraceae bacterium PM6-15]|uniref:nucleotidyltransferase domain-containing protein n=1 Tax=Ohessyouella blattaphilus TaxID=2949333 RepID=UPI003E2A39FB